MKKKFAVLLLAVSLLAGILRPVASAANKAQTWDERFYVQGVCVSAADIGQADPKPFLKYQDLVYIPAETAARWTGRQIIWDSSSRRVTISDCVPENVVINRCQDFHPGAADVQVTEVKGARVFVNGAEKSLMDADGKVLCPILYQKILYLPVCAVGDLLQWSVGYETFSNSERIYLREALNDTQKAEAEAFLNAVHSLSDQVCEKTEALLDAGNFVTAKKLLEGMAADSEALATLKKPDVAFCRAQYENFDNGIAVIRENIASFLADAQAGRDLKTCKMNFSVRSMKAVRGDLNIAWAVTLMEESFLQHSVQNRWL